jgi:hypothetical protein
MLSRIGDKKKTHSSNKEIEKLLKCSDIYFNLKNYKIYFIF